MFMLFHVKECSDENCDYKTREKNEKYCCQCQSKLDTFPTIERYSGPQSFLYSNLVANLIAIVALFIIKFNTLIMHPSGIVVIILSICTFIGTLIFIFIDERSDDGIPDKYVILTIELFVIITLIALGFYNYHLPNITPY